MSRIFEVLFFNVIRYRQRFSALYLNIQMMPSVTIILISIFVCLMSFWIRWRKKRMSLFQKYGIPGPKPHFITGNLMEFNEKKDNCIAEWTEKYGNIFGFFLGGKPYIHCYDAELAKLVQIKEYKNFINRDLILPDAGIPHRLMFETISLLKNEKWKNIRNILSPNFSPGKIKMISPIISDAIKTFIENLTKNKEETLEIYELYKMLTVDVLCKTTMGIETNAQNDRTSKLVKSVNSVFKLDTVDISAILSIWFPEFEPIPTYIRRFMANIKYILNYPCINFVMNTCREIIDFRKKSKFYQPDLLQLLIDAEEDSTGVKRKLTVDSIIGNAAVFLIAGFDATATTLAWCTYYIAKYPDIQNKVRQEIKNSIESDKEIEYADLSYLKYLDQVFSETLRLQMLSVLTIARVCSENFQYKDLIIPKDVVVVIPARNLHKDPNYWKEPEKFDPERFSSKNAGNIDASIYQPFGAGPRSCIGMRLGQTAMMLTIANLVRSFKIELPENVKVEEEHTFFFVRPKNGMNVKLTAIDC